MALLASSAVRVLLSLLLGLAAVPIAQETADDPWYTVEEGTAQVHLYFAWSSTCPHCAEAKPYIEYLDAEYPWLVVHSLQINGNNADNVELVVSLAESIGETVQYVPTFLYCETTTVGWDTDETSGAGLEADLVECQAQAQTLVIEEPTTEPTVTEPTVPPVEEVEAISLPIIGDFDPSTVSLPTFTVVIAAFDAFNPCAFFVLLFLLSLLVHARSRARMAAIGGTFVLVSGIVYFAFMVAWLNVFLLFGTLPLVTVIAGLVAITIAVFNIKDFFWFQQGPSLSIPEEAKPKLFSRMRTLTTSSSFALMLFGTITLAFVANSYELLCTAGFPLVFTRVLTLNDLPTFEYYAYLALYNVVYIIPLLAIVGVFVWTLGSRKLSERGGRILKLMSGLMMLGLGFVLVFASDLLENPITAPAVLLVALIVTGGVVLIDRLRTRRRGPVGTPSPR